MHAETKRQLPSSDVFDPLEASAATLDTTRTFCLSSSWCVVYARRRRLAMQFSGGRGFLERFCRYLQQQNPRPRVRRVSEDLAAVGGCA